MNDVSKPQIANKDGCSHSISRPAGSEVVTAVVREKKFVGCPENSVEDDQTALSCF